MFLQKTYQYTIGYIELMIEGYFVERFVNLCLNRNIEIWDVKRKQDGIIELKIHKYDFPKIEEIAEITKSKVTIQKEVGVPHVVSLYSKRKLFVFIFVLLILLIYLASQRVWKIQIIGDFSIPVEDIKNELKIENVSVGMLKKDLDFDNIKRNIYLRRSDILWLGFEIKGVKMMVEVLERTAPKEEELKGLPCDIVADKEGIISKIFVKEGTKLKNVGDVVTKGETLVSGVMHSNYGGNRYVHANAEITMKTWYTGKVAVPYHKSLVAKSGNIEKRYQIKIGNLVINLLNTVTNFEKYDTINVVKRLTLFGRVELPIEVKEITYEEFLSDDIVYTKEEALELAKEESYTFAKQSIPEEAEIVNCEYKIFNTEDEVIVRATVECIESAGTLQPISSY